MFSASLLLPLMAISVISSPLMNRQSNSTTPASSSVVTVPVPSATVGGESSSIPPPSSELISLAANQALIASLESAATVVDRLALIPNDPDHVYDFMNPPSNTSTTKGSGGMTVKADRKLFPALIGNGVSMTVGFIGPCGFNTPHTHPRSAEMNIIVQGQLGTEYMMENGAKLVRNTLNPFQMTVFPQGALHTEFNTGCDTAIFIAGFASEVPGVQQAAQTLFDLDDDLITAVFNNDFTFNGQDIDQFRSAVPKNVALGVESCLQKCGLAKR